MAKKARYTVRLYRLHDLDLITFSATHEFNIMRAIYSALTAFSKGEVFVIDIPPRREHQLPDLKRVYIKALTLDSEKDAAAIQILEDIAPGYRNSFLKHLLRLYLCHPLSEEYFRVVVREKRKSKDDTEKGAILFETPEAEIKAKDKAFTEKFKIFKDGKKSVQAGHWKKNLKKQKKEEGYSEVIDEEEINMPAKEETVKEKDIAQNDTMVAEDDDFTKPPVEAEQFVESIQHTEEEVEETLTGDGSDEVVDANEVMDMFEALNDI